VLRFDGAGEGAQWKDLKVSVASTKLILFKAKVIEHGIEKPFMAFPAGAKGGNLAKGSGQSFTEEELAKLNEAKLDNAGVTVVWRKMTGGFRYIYLR